MNNSFHIGKVKINGNVILAPMAGITDLPFRYYAKQGGAAAVWSEMISAKALCHNNPKTHAMLAIHKEEHPVAFQIFGSDVRSMIYAAQKVEASGADILDINMGCPVPKVYKTGSGAGLLRGKEWIKIIESIVKNVSIPVTIKIRIGEINAGTTARHISAIAQEEGIQAVIIHARFASQHHTGPVLWDQVAETAGSLSIPVIANGSIIDGDSARSVLQNTRCKAVMIGRACLGDLAIFKRIQTFLDKNINMHEPSQEEKIEQLLHLIRANVSYFGEGMGIKKLRKIMPYYLKTLPQAAQLRNQIQLITSLEEMKYFLKTAADPSFIGDMILNS